MKQQELTVLLCLIWVLTILYGEMFSYWVPALVTCSWPHLSSPSSDSKVQMDGVGSQDHYVKVAVLADPQLMDKTSHRLAPKSLALEILQFYTDIFMRRAFFASVKPFKPDVILFLGDYFDGGPYLSDEEWQESLSRFKHIFGLNAQLRYTDMQVYFLSGNHDVGYASLHSQRPEVIRRYEETFGISNYRFTVGKVDFIAVDAQTLDGHAEKTLASPTWEFVKNVSTDDQLHPRVLLTHIPLYRPDWTSCGPHRSSPVINQRVSHAALDHDILYQNYVTEDSSNYLLDLIKPILILSGHDHDQCSVTHESKFGPVKEHTLGTISWQQGNLHPSFMLLSAGNSGQLNASNPEEAVLTHLCFLPMQTHIYIWYIFLFVLTLLALLLLPTSGVSFFHQCRNLVGYSRQLIASNLLRGGTKEKNEDANYEYEMMWDAEGSMHLVKKPLNASVTNSSEQSLAGRGNAVMRPTAKKHTSQEIEVSVNMDMASGTALDSISNLPPRTGKSKTKIVIQRLVRMLRVLTIIAAVNLPLYMMLLFKDWIDK
ncbi:Protein serine/threonine phosphatase [Quillaja saponaria]|uniref:Protein serine/threonine phosphatase n=1 Tax=Quillaja saponaria TaxID=32244 RepID=A0AAD7LS76_QUISA|nr:Protein serine/threonine phosphatase [Quillaja saponaria]KAJ7963381.1 Protein serine/threonine phosphatase [Quillaja saponaria]